ncbi:hypothetical protein [Acidithiobacillus sp. 'AMD consortium']|uniref:hypothetical protein n=1 Tax=Acidithiobacillus sp. 'AMD consortium' TaxID=2614801 RepID=UPI00178C78E8|nr:hypothetical protein [Acidithiobacillus sp. 'AMD consortium']
MALPVALVGSATHSDRGLPDIRQCFDHCLLQGPRWEAEHLAKGAVRRNQR